MSAAFGLLLSPLAVGISHDMWNKYEDYDKVVDPRTRSGQSIVVEPSKNYQKDKLDLYGNAQDLNADLLLLN